MLRSASKGGEPIPFSELNDSSRATNFGQLRAKVSDLGCRDPATGAEFFDHPDGHPDQIEEWFPTPIASPHVHATNAKGETSIVTYPSGS